MFRPRLADRPARLILLLLLAGGLLTAAVSREPSRVAVVDADRIRTDSSYVRGRLAEMSRPAQRIQDQMRDLQNEITAAAEQYEAQKDAMSAQAEQDARERLLAMREDYLALGQQFQEAVREAEARDLESVRTEIVAAVETLAAERGFDLVFSTANRLYSHPRVDLTDAVIARLDDAAPAP